MSRCFTIKSFTGGRVSNSSTGGLASAIETCSPFIQTHEHGLDGDDFDFDDDDGPDDDDDFAAAIADVDARDDDTDADAVDDDTGAGNIVTAMYSLSLFFGLANTQRKKKKKKKRSLVVCCRAMYLMSCLSLFACVCVCMLSRSMSVCVFARPFVGSLVCL